MINKKHLDYFERCKKYNPSTSEIGKIKRIINQTLPLLKALKEHYNAQSPTDLKNAILGFEKYHLEKISKTGYPDSNLYELQAFNILLKDPSIITKRYEQVKDRPDTHLYYSANLKNTLDLVIVHAIAEVKKIEEYAKRLNITANSKIVTDSQLYKIIQSTVMPVLQAKSIKEKALAVIKKQKENGEACIRQHMTQSLQHLCEFFKTTGCLDSYMNYYNSNSKKFHFEDLTYEMSTDMYTSDTIGLEELFSEKYLETLPIKKLCFLAAEWQNRFAKELANLQTSFAAIDSLNLWEQIYNDESDIKLDDTAIIGFIKKYRFLHDLYTDSFALSQQKLNDLEFKQKVKVSCDHTEDYSDYYNQVYSYIEDDYAKYFAQYLYGNNDFADDINFINPIFNLETLTYRKKQTLLEPLIKITLDNPDCKNWGIVRNEISSGKKVDSIDSNKYMVLIAFDIEGFNMPLRFHISRDSLIEILKLNNPSCIIPEYQGHEDFIMNKDIIPSNIIMPLQKRHNSVIKNHVLNDTENKNFWEHLYFLFNNDKFPSHLQQVTQKSKKQTVSTRMPITYTSLTTGKRYHKDSKNQYIEVDDNARQ